MNTESATARSVATLLVAIVVAIVFAPVTGLYFRSDDFEWLMSARRAIDAGGLPADVNAHFRPLAELHWWIGYRWFGLQSLGYWVGALLTHLVTAIAVGAVARRITGSVAGAMMAALLFAVNITHRGATTWISAAPDRLVGLFSVVALWGVVSRTRRGGMVAVVASGAALASKETALVLLPILLLIEPSLARRASVKWLTLLTAAMAVPHVMAVVVASSYARDRFGVGGHVVMGWLEAMSALLLPVVSHDTGSLSALFAIDSGWRLGGGLIGLFAVTVIAARRVGMKLAWRWLGAVAVALLLPALSRAGLETRWLYLPSALLAPLLAAALLAITDVVPRLRQVLLVSLAIAHVGLHGFLLRQKIAAARGNDQWVRGIIEGAAEPTSVLREAAVVEVMVPFGSELRAWPLGVALAVGRANLEVRIIDDRTSPSPGLPWLDATQIPSRWRDAGSPPN